MDKEQILENHKRRIKRAGPVLWDFMQNLPALGRQNRISFEDDKKFTVEAEKTIEICNTYGLRMIDLMLFLDILNVKYDFDEWHRLHSEQEDRYKNMRQCNNAKNSNS